MAVNGGQSDAVNHAGKPQQLAVKETPIGGAPASITVAPISVNIYRFPLAKGAK